MADNNKPKSLFILGWIIVILGVIFTLLSAFLILGKTVLPEEVEVWIDQYFDFEAYTLLIILMVFRSVYHIVMGIALLKGQNWGRLWFLWLMLIETGLGLLDPDLVDAGRAVIFLIFLYFLTRPSIKYYLGKVTVPLKYTFKSLFSRPLTTVLTILGISLVSFMFCGVLMLANGIAKVLVATGEDDNVVFMEEDKFNEVMSMLSPEEVDKIENLGYFVFDEEYGEQLLSPELVGSITLPDINDTTKDKNVTIRGTNGIAPRLRREFNLIEGEMYEMGLPNCIVGKALTKRMANCNIGDSINVAGDYFQVIGVFETGGTMYDSEIWTDIFTMRDSYNRQGVGGSIVMARLEDKNDIEALKKELDETPDLEVKAFIEKNYYKGQSENTTGFLKYLGLFICVVFALGATIGAMITMYSAVANRTNEIATMRSLGFQAEGIQAAFLIESMMIGALGAVLGIAVASVFSTFEIQMFSTVNFFGEFYLKMTLTLLTVLYTFIFAISMGFVGGVFPSIQATRMKIIDAFR